MLLRRRVRLTSVSAGVATIIVGLGLVGCEGSEFEGDGNDTTTVGTDPSSGAETAATPSNPMDDTGEQALPPNTPPVEPIFGGPPPDETEAADETSAPADTQGGVPTEGPVTSEPEVTGAPGASSEGPGEDTTAEPGGTGTSEEVPADAHCAAVADWDPAWSQWEEEVLQLVNEVRAVGADCGSEGQFGPAEPLSMDPVLRCSARLHSLDMFERDFFDHTNPDGLDPFDRMEEAGFSGSWMGENIAYGQQNPEEVMQAWIDSDGHCSNIMNENYTLLGVGYYPGADSWRDGKQHFWTQNFGAPMRQGGGGGGFGGGFGQ